MHQQGLDRRNTVPPRRRAVLKVTQVSAHRLKIREHLFVAVLFLFALRDSHCLFFVLVCFRFLWGRRVSFLPPTSKIFLIPLRLLSWPAVDNVFQIVAGTFNVVKAGRFYGRYWGAFEKVKNLHFEACCESRGLAFFSTVHVCKEKLASPLYLCAWQDLLFFEPSSG